MYSANFNSNIQSWVNGSSNSWSRVSTGGVSNSGCLTSTIVCEQGQQQGSCINETNYFIATPSVSLTGGNTYQISIKCSVATASTRKLVLGVNTSQARSGATTLQNFGYVSTGGYTAFTVNYTPTSSGSPYFVLWGEKNLTQTVGLWLDDFAVTLVNSAPTVSLTNPDNNSVYVEGDSPFLFKASVSDAENNLSKVEFFSNGTKEGERTSTPLSITYIPTVGGTYSLTAKATDSYGASTTSAARSISFRTRPMISFVTPDIEYSSYAEGPLDLEVNASDADGTVSSVKFYIDDNLVFSDATSPWVYNWTATPGSHTFLAVGTDNQGLESASNFELVGFDVVANTCSLSAPTSSSTTICEGASATFTSGYSSLLTGTIQWQRQPSGGSWANISGATSASYSATLAGNYRGVWTFENGATCTTASKTLVVASNPTVTVAPVMVYGSGPALSVAAASGGTEPYMYSWSTGSCEGISPCDSVMISNFNNPVTVSVLDVNGCGVLDTVSLTHCHSISLSNTGANYSDISPGSELFTQYQAICAGNFVQLHAQTSSGFEGALSWFKNGNLIDGYISDSLIESPDSATIYKVSIPSTSTCESRYAQINVKVINTQTNFTFDSLHCHAHLIDSLAPTLSAFLLSPGAAQGTTQFSQGSLVSYSPTYTTTGRYNLTYIVTDGNYGCSTTNYLHANWSDFKVQVPPVYVNHALTSYGIAVGSLGQPFANPDKYKYEWFKNGVHFADGQQMSAQDTLGPYYAIGTDSLGCNASDTLTYVYRDMYSTRSIWAKNQTYTSASIHWDDKTSVKHFVIIREGKRTSFIPEQGKGYSSDPEFGMASLGSGHFGLFNGEGGSVEITGLAPNKKYYVSAFAWKIVDGDTLWDTTHVQYQLKPKAIPVPKVLEIPSYTGHSVTLKWARKDGFGVILAGRQGNEVTAAPKDSIVYPDSLLFSATNGYLSDGSKVLYNGEVEDSVIVGGLDSNQVYSFKIWYFYPLENIQFYSQGSKLRAVRLNTLSPDSLKVMPDSGHSGGVCRISGKNLLGVDAIKFGEKSTAFSNGTDKYIDAAIPSGAGTVEISIRKNGNWFSTNNSFTYMMGNPVGALDGQKSCGYHEEQPVITVTDPIYPPQTYLGNRITPSGELTILVVFVRLPGQSWNNDAANNPPGLFTWPNSQNVPQIFTDPINGNSYDNFDEFHDDNEDLTLSNFYYQMSKSNPKLDQFKVIFKPFPIVIEKNTPSLMKAAVEHFFALNPQYEGYLEQFDLRSTCYNYNYDNRVSDPDGVFDMELHFSSENVVNAALPGFSSFNFEAYGKTYSIGSNGVHINNWQNWPLRLANGVITHEFSHVWQSAPHVFYNNSVVGRHYNATAGWGTMNSAGEYFPFNHRSNPFETWVMGWNEPRTILNSSDANQGPFYIHDFTYDYAVQQPFHATNCDALRIAIPVPSGSPFQSLWITNHSSSSAMDSQLTMNAMGDVFNPGKGIFFMTDSRGIPSTNQTLGHNGNSPNSLRFLHPFGGIDIALRDATRDSRFPSWVNIPTGRNYPNLSIIRKNPFSCNQLNSFIRLQTPFLNTNSITVNQGVNDGPTNQGVWQKFLNGNLDPGMVFSNWVFGGGSDGSELGLDFDVPIFNDQIYDPTSQDFSPIILSGLHVKVFPVDGENLNQLRKIDVHYNRNRFTKNKMLTGHFNIIDLPDLSPDIIIGSGVEIRVDKTLNPNRVNAGLDNRYPDLITPSRFVCKSGSIFEIESGATLIFENESGFVVENGATVILGENSKIIIKSGGTIVLQSQAIINTHLTSSIIVEDNSYYCFPKSILGSLQPYQLRVGTSLGTVSPKLGTYMVQYYPIPSNRCTNPSAFSLGFECNNSIQNISISGSIPVNVFHNDDIVLENVTDHFGLSGLLDGKYTVRPVSQTGTSIATFSTAFYVYGQGGSVELAGNNSLSNIVILNNSISASSGALTLEPRTNVFVKGAPVNPSNCLGGNCTPSVSGGDITLSGTARMDVRDGVKFQGMCNSMWGGISISDHAGLTAYNNMIFRDSYDGISTLANEDNSDLIQLHVFNAKFENNYRSIKQTDAIESFNFVRNCTFTSDENQMKQPFDRPGASSCVKYISNTHLEYEHCMVNQGNFWNNTISKAQTGLKISNNSRGFYSVLNTFNNNYGKSIHLYNGSGVPTNFDRNVVNLPSDFLFCSQTGDESSAYISYQIPYAKYGFYVEGSGNLPVITNTTISGPGFGTTGGVFRNVGIYSHGASSLSLSQSTLQNLNYELVFYGSQTSGTPLNNVKENNFINNEQNLRFKSNYQANHKLKLNCNKFVYPDAGAAPFTKRYGIYVEDGANMPIKIGGSGAGDEDHPAGNWWPRNVSTSVDVTEWTSPNDWITIRNGSENNWIYYRYPNEFFASEQAVDEVAGNGSIEVDNLSSLIISNLDNPIISGTYLNTTVNPDCFNFGSSIVFPTRKAVEDSTHIKTLAKERKTYLGDPIPNPASLSTLLTFKLENEDGSAYVEVYNLSTGQILKKVGLIKGTSGSVEIGLSSFSSGIYGCRLIANGCQADVKRICVVH